jgi:ACT domain-containing protein
VPRPIGSYATTTTLGDSVRAFVPPPLPRPLLTSPGHPMNTPPRANRVIVTVIGQDRVGIIAGVATILAEASANILDISQTIMEEFFVMIMMVDLEKATIPFEEMKQRLAAKGTEMGLRIDAQHEDVFKYMHRV